MIFVFVVSIVYQMVDSEKAFETTLLVLSIHSEEIDYQNSRDLDSVTGVKPVDS